MFHDHVIHTLRYFVYTKLKHLPKTMQSMFNLASAVQSLRLHPSLFQDISIMQGRYQGVDWRKEENWGCNLAHNPFNLGSIDSVELHPMELMFVKVKHYTSKLEYPSVTAAIQHDKWQQDTIEVILLKTVVGCLHEYPRAPNTTRVILHTYLWGQDGAARIAVVFSLTKCNIVLAG